MTDVHDLNRSFLIVVRDAVKTDQASACTRFNIDPKYAEALGRMTLAEIAEVSETDDVLFRPNLSGQAFSKLVQMTDRTARTVMATMSRTAASHDQIHA